MFSNSLPRSWCSFSGKPNLRQKSLKSLSATVLADLLVVVCLGEASIMVHYHKNIFIATSTFFQMQEVYRDHLKWMCGFNTQHGCPLLSVSFFSLEALTHICYEMSNVPLHFGPKEAVSDQIYCPFCTQMAHFLVKLI